MKVVCFFSFSLFLFFGFVFGFVCLFVCSRLLLQQAGQSNIFGIDTKRGGGINTSGCVPENHKTHQETATPLFGQIHHTDALLVPRRMAPVTAGPNPASAVVAGAADRLGSQDKPKRIKPARVRNMCFFKESFAFLEFLF